MNSNTSKAPSDKSIHEEKSKLPMPEQASSPENSDDGYERDREETRRSAPESVSLTRIQKPAEPAEPVELAEV